MGKGRAGGAGGAVAGGVRNPELTAIRDALANYDDGMVLKIGKGEVVHVDEISRMDASTMAAATARSEAAFRRSKTTDAKKYAALAQDVAMHRRALYLRGLATVEAVGIGILVRDGGNRFNSLGAKAVLFQFFTGIGHDERVGYRNRLMDLEGPGKAPLLAVVKQAMAARRKYPGPNQHVPNPYVHALR